MEDLQKRRIVKIRFRRLSSEKKIISIKLLLATKASALLTISQTKATECGLGRGKFSTSAKIVFPKISCENDADSFFRL